MIAKSLLAELGIRNVFIGGPFFKIVDPETGTMPPHEVQLIEGLITHFENLGAAQIINAHKRERWGTAFMEPPVYTKLDYEGVATSDLVVTMPGCRPPSLGSHIEIGWASALGKPMVLLVEPDGEYSGMIQGLHSLTPTVIVHLVNRQVDFAALDRAIVKVRQAA